MKKTATLPLAAALAVALSAVSNAAVLAQYNFTAGSAASSDTDLLSTASNFTTPTGGQFDTTNGNVYVFSGNSPGTSTPDNFDAGYYFSFTVTPLPTVALNLESLSFDYAFNRTASGGGTALVANYVVRTSADGYANNVATFSRNFLDDTGSTNFASTGNIDLSGIAYQDITDPFGVRIYVYDNSNSSIKSVRLDNVVLNGVAVIPEPSGAMLIGAAGFLVVLRRRR